MEELSCNELGEYAHPRRPVRASVGDLMSPHLSPSHRQNYQTWFTNYPSTHQRAGVSVEVAVASWEGLLAILEKHYPESIFTGDSGDVGAHLIALARANERMAAFIEQHIPGSQVYRASGLVIT